MRKFLAKAIVDGFERKPRDRVPGVHASQCGKCPRALMAELLNPSLKKPFNDTTKGVFKMGHLIDAWAKEATVEAVYDSGHMLALEHHPVETRIGDLTIYGETDMTILDLDKKVIHIIDFKSSDPDSYWMIKKEGEAKRLNAMQVATYMDSVLMRFFIDGGWVVKGWLVYMSKSNLMPLVYPVKQVHIDAAAAYWNDIDFLVGAGTVPEIGNTSVMVPQELWECGYCNLMPAFDGDFPNKSQMRIARGQHRTTCFNLCSSMDFGGNEAADMAELVADEEHDFGNHMDDVHDYLPPGFKVVATGAECFTLPDAEMFPSLNGENG